MVALQTSGDEKQLWADLINQLNGVYDCLSFLGQHRVAGVNQKRGPEYQSKAKEREPHHHLLFPRWQVSQNLV